MGVISLINIFNISIKIDWPCIAALSVDLTAFQTLRQNNSGFNWLVMKQLF